KKMTWRRWCPHRSRTACIVESSFHHHPKQSDRACPEPRNYRVHLQPMKTAKPSRVLGRSMAPLLLDDSGNRNENSDRPDFVLTAIACEPEPKDCLRARSEFAPCVPVQPCLVQAHLHRRDIQHGSSCTSPAKGPAS